MALLWKDEAQTSSTSERVLTGDGDVLMFFFYFENVVMRGKDRSEMAFVLLACLD